MGHEVDTAGSTTPVRRREGDQQQPTEPLAQQPAAVRLKRDAGSHPAETRPVICETIAFLAGHDIAEDILLAASRQAHRNGTTGAMELLAHDRITQDDYYRRLAAQVGLDYLPPGTIAETLSGERRDLREAVSRMVAWCRLENGAVRAAIAPPPGSALIGRLLRDGQGLRNGQFALTTPEGLRSATIRCLHTRIGEEAANRLANEMPRHSAKHGAGAWHGFALAALGAAVLTGMVVAPVAALYAIHALVALFFLANSALRIAAAVDYRGFAPLPLDRHPDARRPVYSVIVALYREAPVVADLVSSLKLLVWPRSKLEIKLVCEADDAETLAALARLQLDARFEIVTVPNIGPRTKPKALNVALPLCSGDFITLYDAEDRPHPDQLEEAWQTFHKSSRRVAALQAPLVIANPRRNWITALFHVEYAAQFRGLLPFLARYGLPVPLGGTSTHFRRAAIERCGVWDPYNVTEDADLGIRLWRAGYRVGVIRRPTLEDAPHRPDDWLRQRTRWIKGWIQTWLVNTRGGGPRSHRNRLTGAAVMHTLLAGTVACSLLYPLTVAMVVGVPVIALLSDRVPVAYHWLSAIDWANIVLALGAQAALGLRTVGHRRTWLALRVFPALPVYWMLGSLAGLRATRQYFTRPFLWEKTPHAPHDPDGDTHADQTEIAKQGNKRAAQTASRRSR